MRPMLASRGTHVPTGAGWSHEVKWDGMRVLADAGGRGRAGTTVRLTSRNENDCTVSFPELHGLARVDALLDGEVVALVDGAPSFGALAERMHVAHARRAEQLADRIPVSYLVFDVLRVETTDLTAEPLSVRRERLRSLDLLDAAWQVPSVYDDGPMLMEATRQQGLEGIVSKRLTSRYEPGVRSPHWLKFPHRRQGSYVVGGWRPETGSATRLGAVLVGEPTPSGLLYRGRVGSGITGRTGPVLLELLEPLARPGSPFADDVPRIDAVGTRWVEPVLVVEVAAQGLSSQLRLRHPSYQGLRSDLAIEDLLS